MTCFQIICAFFCRPRGTEGASNASSSQAGGAAASSCNAGGPKTLGCNQHDGSGLETHTTLHHTACVLLFRDGLPAAFAHLAKTLGCIILKVFKKYRHSHA